jgi:hypothetical protein
VHPRDVHFTHCGSNRNHSLHHHSQSSGVDYWYHLGCSCGKLLFLLSNPTTQQLKTETISSSKNGDLLILFSLYVLLGVDRVVCLLCSWENIEVVIGQFCLASSLSL